MKSLAWIAAALVSVGCQQKAPPATATERVAGMIAADTEREAQEAVDRIDALEGAKAVVMAAYEAMSEHGDRLPSPSEFRAWVEPRLKPKDKPALDAFVWTYPGGDPTMLTLPNETPVGHLGKAVAYADGSVRLDGSD